MVPVACIYLTAVAPLPPVLKEKDNHGTNPSPLGTTVGILYRLFLSKGVKSWQVCHFHWTSKNWKCFSFTTPPHYRLAHRTTTLAIPPPLPNPRYVAGHWDSRIICQSAIISWTISSSGCKSDSSEQTSLY